MGLKLSQSSQENTSFIISALGAIGGALQNYIAMEMFLREIIGGLTSISRLLSGSIHVAAIATGGVCSGMVNFFINMDLLDAFLKRLTSDEIKAELSTWDTFAYYAGIAVFSVTGILFGMMAFTFSASTPLALLAIASGVFVALIMTIQEIETWLQKFDPPTVHENDEAEDWLGTLCGHLIAGGNVLALSLLFTLGLSEVLIALQVAALPAFVIGLSVAFTFGAFTEYYFYDFFLAKFCGHFAAKWHEMTHCDYAPLGFLCIGVNAIVNAALTYSGVGLLAGALVLAGIALPPAGVILALSVVSAIFSGSASLILGMDFWIRKMGHPQDHVETATSVVDAPTQLPAPDAPKLEYDAMQSLRFFQPVQPNIHSELDLSIQHAA